MERMESNSHVHGAAPASPPAGADIHVQKEPSSSWEYQLRKYLMLLATLVTTATYGAGFGPPGGVWEETMNDGPEPERHIAGVPILYDSAQYLAFFYFNATAFAASLVVNLLFLVINESWTVWLAVLRFVMVLDLLALMGAFATGTCWDLPTTVYASTLVVVLAAYVGIQFLLTWSEETKRSTTSQAAPRREEEDDPLKLKKHRKVLLLLATFATEISYSAGLRPPGAFSDGGREAGKPALKALQSPRLMAFFYCNTTAFVASLFVIVLLLGRRLQRYYPKVQLYVFTLVALLGLLGAHAAGSSREADTTAYVVALVGAVPAYIFLVMVAMVLVSDPLKNSTWQRLKSISASASNWLQARGCHQIQSDGESHHSTSPARELWATSSDGGRADADEVKASSTSEGGMEKTKSLILLLATLAATVTYQAGMDPPGGVWQQDDEQAGHYKAGDPILLSTNARRYKVFFYCNSTAFVASLAVIIMVQNKSLIRGQSLVAAMILDLFGLIGAYAAGSSRDVSTSIYVMALAGAALVYVVIHVIFFTLDYEVHNDMGEEKKKKLEKRRKRLLLLAIVVATIAYQAGLSPPGGFWEKHETPVNERPGHTAGSPILHDHGGEFQRRYLAFFYCNSTSFMASVALIITLVNPNLYRPAIRCYALYVCMVVALFGLMGAYAAGSARHLRTSIYVFVLVGAVVAFILVQLLVFPKISDSTTGDAAATTGEAATATGDVASRARDGGDTASESPRPGGAVSPIAEKSSGRRKYIMLFAILAASVTFQAGLKSPGGEDDAGNPVMMQGSNRPRYQAFFYCNSTSFVASIVVIVLLLQESLQNHRLLLHAMNTAIVLDVLGLLGAYVAGSSRDWETSYVIALVAAVFAYIAAHLLLAYIAGRRSQLARVNNSTPQPEQRDVPPCAEV